MKLFVRQEYLKQKVQVVFPEINLFEDVIWSPTDKCTFFYPASDARFKNHDVILEASKLLYQKGITQFRCVFTLKGTKIPESAGYRKKQWIVVWISCG